MGAFSCTATPSVSSREAKAIADRWLARKQGTLRAGKADAFPGYYTLHVLEGDRVAGMLFVNAYTGGRLGSLVARTVPLDDRIMAAASG